MSKVIWSDFASQSLRDVHDYYKDAVSSSVAKRIRQSIFSATRQLINHPESGQIEKNLLQLNESHRSFIGSHINRPPHKQIILTN
jgi:plasmid stabilization system protein ParE